MKPGPEMSKQAVRQKDACLSNNPIAGVYLIRFPIICTENVFLLFSTTSYVPFSSIEFIV